MYHVSKKWLAQTITAQTDDDPKEKTHARKLFENRVSQWTYPQHLKDHNYEIHIGIDKVYYFYHNPEAGRAKCST